LITILQKKEKENIDLKKSMLGSRLKSSVSSSVASGDDDLEMYFLLDFHLNIKGCSDTRPWFCRSYVKRKRKRLTRC